MKALVLAVGEGRRRSDDPPWPLVVLGGLPLLERSARGALAAGASEVLAVLGGRAEEVEAALAPRLAGLPVRLLRVPDWDRGDGAAILAARPLLGREPFLLLRGDRLLPPSLLKGLAERSPSGACWAAVDRRRGPLRDPAGAMKARLDGDRVSEIGRGLEPFDAFDTGAALCGPEFLDALAGADRPGEPLSREDALRALAARGRLRAHDAGEARWERADGPESLRAAERVLLESLRKPTDGFLARHLERRLSLRVTRALCRLPLTPNAMSLVSMGVGLAGAACFASPERGRQVLGGVLFWLSSVLDGCDGELARLKFQESRLGAWLDLLGDNLVHLAVFAGMGLGLGRATGELLWPRLGGWAVAGTLLSAGLVSLRLLERRKAASETLFVSVDEGEAREGVRGRLARLADALSRRDFAFYLVFVTALGWHRWFLWAAAAGANLYFLVLLGLRLTEPPPRA